MWSYFNSIKNVVRLFFIVNIALVLFNYVFTYITKNSSQEDRKYVQVSKENENLTERLKFISKAIVKSGEVELKDILKNEVDRYSNNLDALKNGGQASISNGKEIIGMREAARAQKEIDDLSLAWSELKKLLKQIEEKPIEIDTNLIQESQSTALADEGLFFPFLSADSAEKDAKTREESKKEQKKEAKTEERKKEVKETKETKEKEKKERKEDNLKKEVRENKQIKEAKTDSLAKVRLEQEKKEAPQNIDTTQNNRRTDILSQEEILPFQTVINPEVERIYYQAEASLDEVSNKNRDLSKVLERNYEDSQNFLGTVLFWTFLANMFILVGGTFVIGGYLINPLKKISSTAKEIAAGNINIKSEYNSNNEIGEVSDSLNLIVGSFRQYTNFAENIGKGNFESNFDVKSDKDVLGYSLLQMRDNLKRIDEEDEKRNWINEGFALFSNILRTTDLPIEDFSYEIISNLVKYVNANQGGLFLIGEDENSKFLELKAAFAYDKRKFEDRLIHIGQGLVGQAVLEKDLIYLDKVPDDYIKITSGLGGANPRCLLIVPLMLNNEAHGVLEIASFHYFDKDKIDFISKLSENIASTLASVKINENTKRLLEESKVYAEQMQSQEEEMRQNLEELASTQEEMEKNQRKLEDYKANLELEVEKRTAEVKIKELQLSTTLSQMQAVIESSRAGIVSLNRDYRVVAANQRIKEIIRLIRDAEFEVGEEWFKIFKNDADKLNAKKLWDQALNGKYVSIEDKFGDHPEKRKWFDVSFNPVVSQDKEIIGATMFIRDITERKKEQKNIEIYARILNNSSNEVYIFDAETYKFSLINEKGKNNLGFTPEEINEMTYFGIDCYFNPVSMQLQIQPLLKKEVNHLIFETTFQRKDGSRYLVEMNLQMFEDEESKRFAAIAQDITERKLYESQLNEALERFDLATKATNEGLWEMYINNDDYVNPANKVWWSKQFEALLGLAENQLEKELGAWLARIHQDDKEKTLYFLQNHLLDKSGQTPFNIEYRLLHSSNQFMWFSALAETLRDAEGNPKRVAGSIVNIDQRKKTEQDLLLQTATLNGILNANINAIISFNKDGAIFSVNQACERIFGYQMEELFGVNINIILAEPNSINLMQNFELAKNIKGRKGDGSIITMDMTVTETRVGDGKFYVGIFRDTTEMVEKENNLTQSEQKLRKLTEAMTEGIFFHDRGIITDVNEPFEKITGYFHDELIGMNAFNLLTPESKKIAMLKADLDVDNSAILELINKDQEVIPVELTFRALQNNGSLSRCITVKSLLGIREDEISEKVDKDQQEKVLKDIINLLPEFVCYTDANNQLKYINNKALSFLGYTRPEDLLNNSIAHIYPQEVIDLMVKEWLPSSLHNGHWQGNTVIKTQFNELKEVTLHIIPHFDKEGKPETITHIIYHNN